MSNYRYLWGWLGGFWVGVQNIMNYRNDIDGSPVQRTTPLLIKVIIIIIILNMWEGLYVVVA